MEYKLENNNFSKIVSKNLKELMDIYSITTGDVVDKSGLPYSSIHSVLTGKTNPTIGTLAAIAKALNIQVGQLLGEIPFNTCHYTRYHKKVPLIKWEQLIYFLKDTEAPSINNYDEILISSNHFITNQSFVIAQNRKELSIFSTGTLFFFDIITEGLHNYNERYVLIENTEATESMTLRKLYFDGENLFIEHHNPQIPIRKLHNNEKIHAWLFRVQADL